MQPITTTQAHTPPILAHVDASSGAKETSLDTGDSEMAHKTRATETTQTALSTACVEECFAGKKTAQDNPTIAPSPPPIEYLLVNIHSTGPRMLLSSWRWAVTKCACVRGFNSCVLYSVTVCSRARPILCPAAPTKPAVHPPCGVCGVSGDLRCIQ